MDRQLERRGEVDETPRACSNAENITQMFTQRIACRAICVLPHTHTQWTLRVFTYCVLRIAYPHTHRQWTLRVFTYCVLRIAYPQTCTQWPQWALRVFTYCVLRIAYPHTCTLWTLRVSAYRVSRMRIAYWGL
jgi:hypothetical protein